MHTINGFVRPWVKLPFLREYELAGILADDMGLGKTVQTLAHLAIEKRAGRMRQPSLIVAPTSLIGNWRREAHLFTPRLPGFLGSCEQFSRNYRTPIEQALKEQQIRYSKLTGQTHKRDEAIDAFRSGQVNLFLISLKAGGGIALFYFWFSV